jgi:transposase-like protein
MLTSRSVSSSLFKRRHFDSSIIILCVRRYITYKLSYRDLRDMMAERGIYLAHTTILRWIQHYVPEFEKQWQRYLRPVGSLWRVDETYIRVKDRWTYLYRAVNKQGNTVDFLLSEQRDIAAAKRFFKKAIDGQGTPEKIPLDGYVAMHTAVQELKESATLPMNVCVRKSRYLNNLLEVADRPVTFDAGTRSSAGRHGSVKDTRSLFVYKIIRPTCALDSFSSLIISSSVFLS